MTAELLQAKVSAFRQTTRTSAMRPTTRRLVSLGIFIVILSLIGFVLALVFQWPAQFTLDEAADSTVTLGDFVQGTVTSIPLAPTLVLVVATALAASRRWWGTVGAVLLALIGPVFVLGGLGEAFAESTPDVPRAVLVTAGTVYVLLGASLLLLAVIDLVDRVRNRRARSRGERDDTVSQINDDKPTAAR